MAYFAILTSTGADALATALATSTPLEITHVAIGDGGGSPIDPDSAMAGLVNERARVTVNLIEVDPSNPNRVRVEGLFPVSVGGFTIREAGLFAANGDMIAIASYPPIYKPTVSEGASVAEYIRVPLEYVNIADAVELTVDNSTVMATRQYVDNRWTAFGDGSDGDLVFDGVSGGGGTSLVGSTYTAQRDIFADDCTVTGSGIRLNMAGFRLYVRGKLTTSGGAKISNNGTSATNQAVPSWTNAGTLPKGGQATAGRTTDANGSDASAVATSYGGAGGAGGNSGTAKTGGQGGTISNPGATRGSWHAYSPATFGFIFGYFSLAFTGTAIDGGGGGGGGAGSGTGNGGAGGNGGGVMAIAAFELDLESASDIECRGGNGAAASGGNNGGGGGGGGGTLLIAYGTKSPAITFAAATNCPGGTHGAGSGTGTNGTDGSNGNVLELKLVAA